MIQNTILEEFRIKWCSKNDISVFNISFYARLYFSSKRARHKHDNIEKNIVNMFYSLDEWV